MTKPNITITLTLDKEKSEIKVQATNDSCTEEEIKAMLRLIEPVFKQEELGSGGCYIEDYVKLELPSGTKPTFSTLEIMTEQKQREAERVQMAIKLNICPECGADIIEELWEKRPPSKFLGFTINNDRKWDFRKVCKNNVAHYESKYYTDGYGPY